MTTETKYPTDINADIPCIHCGKKTHATIKLELTLSLGRIELAYSDGEPEDVGQLPPQAKY